MKNIALFLFVMFSNIHLSYSFDYYPGNDGLKPGDDLKIYGCTNFTEIFSKLPYDANTDKLFFYKDLMQDLLDQNKEMNILTGNMYEKLHYLKFTKINDNGTMSLMYPELHRNTIPFKISFKKVFQYNTRAIDNISVLRSITKKHTAFLLRNKGLIIDSERRAYSFCYRESDIHDGIHEDAINNIFKHLLLGLWKDHKTDSDLNPDFLESRNFLQSHWGELTGHEQEKLINNTLETITLTGSALFAAKIIQSKYGNKTYIRKKKVPFRIKLGAILSGGLFSSGTLAIGLTGDAPKESPYEYFFTTYGTEKLIYWDDYNYEYACKNHSELKNYLNSLSNKLAKKLNQ